jgi:hypothetical protein
MDIGAAMVVFNVSGLAVLQPCYQSIHEPATASWAGIPHPRSWRDLIAPERLWRRRVVVNIGRVNGRKDDAFTRDFPVNRHEILKKAGFGPKNARQKSQLTVI